MKKTLKWTLKYVIYSPSQWKT